MFYKNWINKSRIFFVVLLLFVCCNEDKSIILNPSNGESYKYIQLDASAESYSFRPDTFNAGKSSRLYLSRDDSFKSYVLFKLKSELFTDNLICNEEDINKIKSVDLRIPIVTDLSNFLNSFPDSSQIYDYDFETHPDNQVKAYLLEDSIDNDFEESALIHEDGYIEISNLSELSQFPVNIVANSSSDNLSIDLRGYLYSIYDISTTDSEIDCESLIYSDCICNSWQDSTCLEANNACYWNNPTSNINNYTNGNFCFNNQSIALENNLDDWCNGINGDINILLDFSGMPNGEDFIEFYSTDSESDYTVPYLLVRYDVNDVGQEYVFKYHIDSVESDYLDNMDFISNISDDSQQSGMVLGIDNSILSFVDMNNSNNLDCSISDCSQFETNPMIEQNYEGELFSFEITLDEIYSDMYSEIDFYFNNVYFVYQELDPSGDNWEDCGTDGDCSIIDEDNSQDNTVWDIGEKEEGNGRWDFQDCGLDGDCDKIDSDGSQENGIVNGNEKHELFDDYGLDLCPDQNESGNGQCDEENSLYNIEGTENNGAWDKGDGVLGDYESCEQFECEIYYDYGLDEVDDNYESGCFDENNGGKLDLNNNETYSDILQSYGQDILTLDVYTNINGQTICGPVHWEDNCHKIGGRVTCSENDPNGDNYNEDPANDNWPENDCGSDGNCLIEDIDGSQGNGVWDLGERTENNNRYDVGEIFFDYGVDGLPDLYENFDYAIEDDNWNDCGADGDCDIIDETQNNGIWDIGEGTENNGQYDEGETYFDYGIDQLDSKDEEGYNNVGKENNLKYDVGEIFFDYGLDHCLNGNELNDGTCCDSGDCGISLTEYEDPHNDNYLIDPNSDNYNEETNPDGKENNNIRDVSEDLLIEEMYYDYGFDQIVNEEENNYYANLVDLALGSNLYSLQLSANDYNQSDENITNYSKPSFSSTDNLGLWISSIERIDQDRYKINVDIHSYIDVIAFQFQLKHIPYNQEIETLESRSLYLFSPEFNDENSNGFPESSEFVENGIKYILDASIYQLPNWCLENQNCAESDNGFDISYGYGKKIKLDFVYDVQGVNHLFDEFISDKQNSNISDELTSLIFYFDKSDNSSHDVINGSSIIVEYLDENNNYVLFDDVNIGKSISSDIDSVKIDIGPLIQKYINNEIDYRGIILSSGSASFNFSNISIIRNGENKPKLELFYSE